MFSLPYAVKHDTKFGDGKSYTYIFAQLTSRSTATVRYPFK